MEEIVKDQQRGMRKERQGIVESVKMDKTIVVSVLRLSLIHI